MKSDKQAGARGRSREDATRSAVEGVSRREFFKIAGVAGAALGMGAGLGGLVAACGEEAETTTTAGATTTAAAASTTTTTAREHHHGQRRPGGRTRPPTRPGRAADRASGGTRHRRSTGQWDASSAFFRMG